MLLESAMPTMAPEPYCLMVDPLWQHYSLIHQFLARSNRDALDEALALTACPRMGNCAVSIVFIANVALMKSVAPRAKCPRVKPS